jgi:hypothetical protein
MWFAIGVIVGAVQMYAYQKGWLAAPAIFIVKTVKGWFA